MVRETSIMSYKELIESDLISSRQATILNGIKWLGVCSDSEIMRFLGAKDRNFVSPRRKELLDSGVIEDVGKRSCLVTGRTVFVWKIRDSIRFVKSFPTMVCPCCKGNGKVLRC